MKARFGINPRSQRKGVMLEEGRHIDPIWVPLDMARELLATLPAAIQDLERSMGLSSPSPMVGEGQTGDGAASAAPAERQGQHTPSPVTSGGPGGGVVGEQRGDTSSSRGEPVPARVSDGGGS